MQEVHREHVLRHCVRHEQMIVGLYYYNITEGAGREHPPAEGDERESEDSKFLFTSLPVLM